MDYKLDIKDLTLQNILQYTSLGIHVIDKEYNTIIYNETMAQLEGMEKSKVLGENMFKIFPTLDEDTSTLTRVLKTGKAIEDRVQNYKNINGEEIVSINTTIPLFDEKKIIGAMEISNNITHIKELTDKLIDFQKLVQDKNKQIENIQGSINRYTFDDLIGEADRFVETKEIAKIASKSNSSMLIYGDTGTGKELFAQSIHYSGDRRHEPFIAQNCAAIPDTLLEGILFGTEAGSFTGALEKKGIFEQADGGTLLLDEINSMSTDLQAKLLRVLQENYIRRLGGKKDIPIDVRIIATTNQEPMESVEKGIIRKDLYYRINVISLTIPRLEQRRSDIPLLVDHFIKKHNKKLNKHIIGVSDEILDKFHKYHWPGNVRELENVIESAMNIIPKNTRIIDDKYFPAERFFVDQDNGICRRGYDLKSKSLNEYLDSIENHIIKVTYKENDYNISKSAEDLGISRQSLQYKLKKYGL